VAGKKLVRQTSIRPSAAVVTTFDSFPFCPQGNEILSNLTQAQYERVLQVLENAILATDLALYFRYEPW